MALSDDALVTLAEFRAIATGYDSVADSVLEQLIDDASLEAKRFTRRDLAAADRVELYDGSVCRFGTLELRLYPIISITSVKIDSTGEFGADSAITDYIQDDATQGRLFRRDGWPAGVRNIQITYRGGYELGSVPADIKSAVVELAMFAYRRRTSDQVGATSAGYGDVNVSYQDGLPPMEVKHRLERYREVRV